MINYKTKINRVDGFIPSTLFYPHNNLLWRYIISLLTNSTLYQGVINMNNIVESVENIIHLSSFTGERCGIELVRNLLNAALEQTDDKKLSAVEINRIIVIYSLVSLWRVYGFKRFG